jgi:hypothetical protein
MPESRPQRVPIVQKVWNFCHTPRDDDVGYGDDLEQRTYRQALRRLWSERLALHRNWEVVKAKESLKDIETVLRLLRPLVE